MERNNPWGWEHPCHQLGGYEHGWRFGRLGGWVYLGDATTLDEPAGLILHQGQQKAEDYKAGGNPDETALKR